MTGLSCQNLTTGLSCQNLTELPDNLPVNLRYLDCSENQITSLDSGTFSKLNSLEYLYCTGNQITSIDPGVLPNSLITLDCSGNQITSLDPNSLPNSLTYLDCAMNPITSIQGLPDSLVDFYCDRDELKFVEGIPIAEFEQLYSNFNLISYRKWKAHVSNKNKAARIIQKACYNWLFNVDLKDNLVGIVPRIGWKLVQEMNKILI